LRDRLDAVVKGGAVGTAILYVAGFIVVSLHDASYGFVTFSFLRARLITAGLLLLFFLFVPTLESAKAFGLFGLKAPFQPPELRPDILNNAYVFGMRIPTLFLRGWIASFFLRYLLLDTDLRASFLIFYVVFVGIHVAADTQIQRHFAKHPFWCVVFELLVIATGIGGLIILRQWTVVELLAWFLIVGYATTEIAEPIRNPHLLLELSWHNVLPMALGVLGFFAIYLYPRVPPQIGGGQPIEISIDVLNGSPIAKSLPPTAWLVDEVDEGFYIVGSKTDRNAVLIPRPSVSAIQFHSHW
jgi:hypothetical protein